MTLPFLALLCAVLCAHLPVLPNTVTLDDALDGSLHLQLLNEKNR
jgi:hypothetical protein